MRIVRTGNVPAAELPVPTHASSLCVHLEIGPVESLRSPRLSWVLVSHSDWAELDDDLVADLLVALLPRACFPVGDNGVRARQDDMPVTCGAAADSMPKPPNQVNPQSLDELIAAVNPPDELAQLEADALSGADSGERMRAGKLTGLLLSVHWGHWGQRLIQRQVKSMRCGSNSIAVREVLSTRHERSLTPRNWRWRQGEPILLAWLDAPLHFMPHLHVASHVVWHTESATTSIPHQKKRTRNYKCTCRACWQCCRARGTPQQHRLQDTVCGYGAIGNCTQWWKMVASPAFLSCTKSLLRSAWRSKPTPLWYTARPPEDPRGV